MISEKELLDAIEECETLLPNNFSTCEKLAVFYTVLDHLQAKDSFTHMMSPESVPETVIGQYGTTEFYLAVKGKESKKIWSIFGELMDALKVLNPKLYSRTIERLTAVE